MLYICTVFPEIKNRKIMNLLEFYVTLRRELMTILSGVENARNGSWAWDDTTPNYITRRRLSEIHLKYVRLAARFGLYVVVRHGNCGNENHDRRSTNGYVMDAIDDVKISYRDARFRWLGGQMYQGPKMCICPCSATTRPTTHHVIEDVIYDVMGNQKTCQAIEGILGDIYDAIDAAADGKARSGIREYLLRALLRINDVILPMTMDEFVEHQQKIAGLTPSPP
jgi:hypothetical protein